MSLLCEFVSGLSVKIIYFIRHMVYSAKNVYIIFSIYTESWESQQRKTVCLNSLYQKKKINKFFVYIYFVIFFLQGPGERCGEYNNANGVCGEGMWCSKRDFMCHGCFLATMTCYQEWI